MRLLILLLTVGSLLAQLPKPGSTTGSAGGSGTVTAGTGIAVSGSTVSVDSPFSPKVVKTNSTVATITGCSVSAPCTVRVGNNTLSLTTEATATISAGSDTAYVYVNPNGDYIVAAGADTVVCSSCTATADTGFGSTPVFPIATLTASSGTWGTLADARAMFAMDKPLMVGTGLVLTETDVQRTLAQDTSVLTKSVCVVVIGTGASGVIQDSDLADIVPSFQAPWPLTVTEVDVEANDGTPDIIVSKKHGATVTDLVSGALATGASGAVACASTSTTYCVDGSTAKSGSISIVTAGSANILSAGDRLQLTSGTAGGTAKAMRVCVIGSL